MRRSKILTLNALFILATMLSSPKTDIIQHRSIRNVLESPELIHMHKQCISGAFVLFFFLFNENKFVQSTGHTRK